MSEVRARQILQDFQAMVKTLFSMQRETTEMHLNQEGKTVPFLIGCYSGAV